MSFFGDLFGGKTRRARAAEAEGRHREAAALWAELGQPVEAARCLEHVGDKAPTSEERISVWLDALAMLPAIAVAEQKGLEAKLGRALLEGAREHGVATSEERARVLDAAGRLERAEQWVEAAEAYGWIERRDDQARCLELGGEIERLESLLAEGNASEAKEARIRRLASESELAMALGDRESARANLRQLVALAPDDLGFRRLARSIEERWASPPLALSVGGRRISFSARLPAIIGRSEADVVVRGTSVSRQHAEIALVEGRFVVRDLGSRNGTLISGVLLSGELPVEGPLRVGLGEDVELELRPAGDALHLEVLSGLDRGARHVLGRGSGVVPIPGVEAKVELRDEGARLAPTASEPLELLPAGASEARKVRGRIDLLRGDRVDVAGVRVEVLT